MGCPRTFGQADLCIAGGIARGHQDHAYLGACCQVQRDRATAAKDFIVGVGRQNQHLAVVGQGAWGVGDEGFFHGVSFDQPFHDQHWKCRRRGEAAARRT